MTIRIVVFLKQKCKISSMKTNKVAVYNGHRGIVYSFVVEIQLAEDHRKHKLS